MTFFQKDKDNILDGNILGMLVEDFFQTTFPSKDKDKGYLKDIQGLG